MWLWNYLLPSSNRSLLLRVFIILRLQNRLWYIKVPERYSVSKFCKKDINRTLRVIPVSPIMISRQNQESAAVSGMIQPRILIILKSTNLILWRSRLVLRVFNTGQCQRYNNIDRSFSRQITTKCRVLLKWKRPIMFLRIKSALQLIFLNASVC